MRSWFDGDAMGKVTFGLTARFHAVGGAGGITAEVPIKRIGTLLAPIVVAAGVAEATRTNALPLALGASAVLILLLIGLRSPILVLALFAALVPIENALNFSGVGTASRVVGIVFAVAYVVNRYQLPRLSTMPASGWAFVVWAVASGLWAVDFAAWSGSIVTLVQMVVLALLVGDLVSRDPPAARRVLWAFSASAVATVFLLVAAPSQTGGFAGVNRLAAFSGQDPAEFSAVLLPAFLFLVYEGSRAASRRDAGRIAALFILVGAGLLVWGALVSGTRSAMVGLGVGLAAMTAIGTGHRNGRVAVAAAGVVGAGSALLAPGVVDSVMNRLSDAITTGGAGREDIWAVGTTIFGQHPLVGVGYANFPSAFTLDVIRITNVPGLQPGVLTNGRDPHSILLEIAAELGIVGIALFGLFLWRVLSARSGLPLSNFVRAALVAMLAQAMFLTLIERKQLWLILGIAIGLAASARVQEAGTKAVRIPLDTRAAPARTSLGRPKITAKTPMASSSQLVES